MRIRTKLTPKQELFCKEYIIDFNATRAAIASKYSEKTAKTIGGENLSKLVIQDRIKELMTKREERTEITADMVVKELLKVAMVQESDFYHEDGTVKQLSELSENQKSALKSYTTKTVKIGRNEYEEVPIFVIHDKLRSLELLGKHLAMFTEVRKVEGEITVKKGLNDFYDEVESE